MTWVYNASSQVDHASDYPAIIAVTLLFCSLMLVVVVTRGVLRRHALSWDDRIIFATALFSITYTVMAIVQTRWGLGLPIALRPKQNTYRFKVLSYAGKPWYPLTLAGYKLALCVAYLRLIDGIPMPRYRRLIIGVGVASVVLQIIFLTMNLLNCIPIAKSFDTRVAGHCLPFPPVQYTMAIVGIICDVVVFLLPIRIFLRLSLDKNEVLGLCLLFSCGLVTTICSIARAVFLREVGPTGNGNNTMVTLMGCVEANVGIIMSCLPFLRGFLKGILKRYRCRLGYRGDRINQLRAGKSTEVHATDMYASPGHPRSHATSGKPEHGSRANSEEAILGSDDYSTRASHGIIRTTQFHVLEEDLGKL